MPSNPTTLDELIEALREEAFACETACEPHEHQTMPTTQIIVSKDGHLYRADLMERAAKVLRALNSTLETEELIFAEYLEDEITQILH